MKFQRWYFHYQARAENVSLELTACLAKQLKLVMKRIELLLFTSYRFKLMLYL